MIGEPLDYYDEVALLDGDVVHTEYLDAKDGYTIRFNFTDVYFMYGEYLFTNNKSYTFRKYGKLKDFTWKKADSDSDLVVKIDHVPKLKRSPKIDPVKVQNLIHEERVYGLKVSLDEIKVVKAHLKHHTSIFTDRYPNISSDIQYILDTLGESDVIGLKVNIDYLEVYDVVIVVDQRSKELLDKLTRIYDNLKEYIEKNKITLGAVLKNLDLYYCIALGV